MNTSTEEAESISYYLYAYIKFCMQGALISFFFIPVFEQHPVTFGSRDNLQTLNKFFISTGRKNQHVSQSLKSTCLPLLRKFDVALAFCGSFPTDQKYFNISIKIKN